MRTGVKSLLFDDGFLLQFLHAGGQDFPALDVPQEIPDFFAHFHVGRFAAFLFGRLANKVTTQGRL